jgi:hypothetical protein
MGAMGFKCKNPPGILTWVGPRESNHLSIIDLVLANDLACYSAQLEDITVSLADSLKSDHATLTFEIFPLDSITLIPCPAPSSFKVDNKLKNL